MKTLNRLFYFVVATTMLISCGKDPLLEEAKKSKSDELTLKSDASAGETAYADAGTGTFIGFTDQLDYIATDGCPDYGVYEYTLYAGKTNDAGTVVISNSDEYLFVTYNTNGTADLKEAHVYVWTDESQIPEKRPAPGQAPYIAEGINADCYTFMIPLSDFNISEPCGSVFYVSTHAALIEDGVEGDDDDDGTTTSNDGETAYAGGSNTAGGFTNGNGAWWGYVTYTVECFYNISGTVYNDADSSFDLDNGELGFEGITVSLVDASGNEIASTTTAEDGSYVFEHVAAGQDYKVIVGNEPTDYIATENANGYTISNLNSCVEEIDFGFYMDDPNNGGGGGGNGNATGALSFVSFATYCSESVSDYSTGGDFEYNVEIDYQQTTGNIKFEAIGDQLGEDGAQESDSFSFTIACDVSEILVTTKNQDTESYTFTLGESHDMGNGFVVVWNSKTDNGSDFSYSFTVTSD